ncbi:MAG: hypothetical protein A4E65_03752 [Syntrophorhabdus sp. PtaU1.Bin153]|nr:MAG: hypothetical protein A4E65_03752 [Syntrophorhabdus sp. PtaU1.Bin153]
MSKQNQVCPFLKTTCKGCSLYRGRHMGLWPSHVANQTPDVPFGGNGPEWVSALNTFFKNMGDREGTMLNWDEMMSPTK